LTAGGATPAVVARVGEWATKIATKFGIPAAKVAEAVEKLKAGLTLLRAPEKVAEEVATTIGKVGCFVAGTLSWVSAPMFVRVEADSSSTSLGDSSSYGTNEETAIPIEAVMLGQRVPTRNPMCNEDYSTAKDNNYFGWKRITLEVCHANGSIVDVQLLRSEDWIERNGLRAGERFDLLVTEIELDASAFVVSIEDGPEVLPGEGAVVTGRFVTRQGSDLVRVTLEDGTKLVGTSSHPVWSPVEMQWRGLGEFKSGQYVQTRFGFVAVSVESLPDRVPVYNIEVDGEHVYEVTDLGILVHNATGFNCARYVELYIKKYSPGSKLTAAESRQFNKLAKELKDIDFGAYLRSKIGPPSAGMENAHAHHVLFKSGLSLEQKQLIAKGMEILEAHGIDPVLGLENLVWAPNVKGQHSIQALQKVVDELEKAHNNGLGTKDDILKALKKLKRVAAGR
jgi:hypothetical protein